MSESALPPGFRLVRLVPVGNGSHRVTIPKDMLVELFGEDEYVAISRTKNGLLLAPVEVTPKMKVPKEKK